MKNEYLETAIRAGGGIVAFAAAMGVTHQAVTAWRKRGRVPLGRAIAIESLYSVPAEKLLSADVAALAAAMASRASACDVL